MQRPGPGFKLTCYGLRFIIRNSSKSLNLTSTKTSHSILKSKRVLWIWWDLIYVSSPHLFNPGPPVLHFCPAGLAFCPFHCQLFLHVWKLHGNASRELYILLCINLKYLLRVKVHVFIPSLFCLLFINSPQAIHFITKSLHESVSILQ